MKNLALKNSLKSILENHENHKVTKGTIGDCSIEIEQFDPPSFDSYLYSDETKRDADFEELNSLINEKTCV